MKNLIIAAALLMPAAAGAQQNIKLGDMSLNPFISSQEQADSNIYLTDKNVKSALINRSAIGTDLKQKFGSRLDLTGNYTFELLSYSQKPSINNAVHNNASLGLEGRLPGDSKVKAGYKFLSTTDQATSQDTARAKRIERDAMASFEAPLKGKFGFGVNFGQTYQDYHQPSFRVLDRGELTVGANVNYMLQPKTKLFVGYTYGKLDYQQAASQTGNATYDNFNAGITGKLTGKLVGTVSAGAQLRHLSSSIVPNHEAATLDYSAQLVYTPMEKTEVVAYAKRGNVETDYVNSHFYTSTLSNLAVTREIRKWKVGANVGVETVKYAEKVSGDYSKRFDVNNTAGLTADYNIQKWLKASFGYTYKYRASNTAGMRYADNIGTFGLKGMF